LSSLADRSTALQSRIESIDQEIARVDEAFVELAAQFSSIDGQESLRQASQLETRLIALRREKSLCLSAQSHVTQEQLREKEQEAAQDRRATLATAKQHADAVCILNAEIDTHLTQLRQLFERRFGLLSQLAATGVVDQQFIVKLQGKSGPTRASCAAGLHKYISIEKVATGSFVTLASCNVILLSIGKESVISSSPLSGTVDQHPLPATVPAPTTNGGKDAPEMRAYSTHLTNGGDEPTRRRRRIFGGPND
jgi:hypothetical protein